MTPGSDAPDADRTLAAVRRTSPGARPSGERGLAEFAPTAAHFILYVADQGASSAFYARVLGIAPRLDVPGMTEFELGPRCVLGLMPEAGIRRLLGARLPDPERARGVPRAELYLVVDDADACHARALACGAVELSAPAPRDWGQRVGYVLDPDGHVLACASAAP
ncbi:MAG: VOC family protein [Planctomycetes bacterium]|nr:VOC family protein [Planctomycetota bacterium]